MSCSYADNTGVPIDSIDGAPQDFLTVLRPER
jgi:hypothetical protein